MSLYKDDSKPVAQFASQIAINGLLDQTLDYTQLPVSQSFYVHYIPNSQRNTYKFVDDDENGKQVGNDVLINGTTDETVKLKYTVPENYVLVAEQPTEYTFKASDN